MYYHVHEYCMQYVSCVSMLPCSKKQLKDIVCSLYAVLVCCQVLPCTRTLCSACTGCLKKQQYYMRKVLICTLQKPLTNTHFFRCPVCCAGMLPCRNKELQDIVCSLYAVSECYYVLPCTWTLCAACMLCQYASMMHQDTRRSHWRIIRSLLFGKITFRDRFKTLCLEGNIATAIFQYSIVW